MKLKRIKKDKMICGVLAGIAYALGVQTWIVRVVFIIACFLTAMFPLLLAYIVLSFVLNECEEDPSDYDEICR